MRVRMMGCVGTCRSVISLTDLISDFERQSQRSVTQMICNYPAVTRILFKLSTVPWTALFTLVLRVKQNDTIPLRKAILLVYNENSLPLRPCGDNQTSATRNLQNVACSCCMVLPSSFPLGPGNFRGFRVVRKALLNWITTSSSVRK